MTPESAEYIIIQSKLMQCDNPSLNIICHMTLGYHNALLSDGHAQPILAPLLLDIKTRTEGFYAWPAKTREIQDALHAAEHKFKICTEES